MRAQAADGLAKLEAAQRSSTTIGTGSGVQLSRMKAIRELSDQVRTWEWLLAVARHEDLAIPYHLTPLADDAAADDVDADKEFPEGSS